MPNRSISNYKGGNDKDGRGPGLVGLRAEPMVLNCSGPNQARSVSCRAGLKSSKQGPIPRAIMSKPDFTNLACLVVFFPKKISPGPAHDFVLVPDRAFFVPGQSRSHLYGDAMTVVP